MDMISLEGKTNFFEKRVAEYQKSGVMASLENPSAQKRVSAQLGSVRGVHNDCIKQSKVESYQSSLRKKTATAVAFAKQGRGLIKVNGQPIENIEPEVLRLKVFEPVLIVGQDKFANLDIRIRVKGGGITAQIYAIRAAIAKSIVAYHAKYVDESSKNELRKTLIDYDRTLLVSDPRRCEPKKYGGRSARARFQKSYR
eukprot:scaffold443_cov125-Cylindrotheca_fusiformis.AAC.17